MTLRPSTIPTTIDAVRLLSAAGDLFSGRPIGFGMHVANVAGRFTAYRGCDDETVADVYYAAALHHIGAVSTVIARDTTPRHAEFARWDDPPVGAAIVASLDVFSPATADAIRWHREAFDGTGFPDRLRWNGIPAGAMAVNIARAFVSALEAQADSGGSAADAVFTLVDACGTVFALPAMSAFREFLAACVDDFDAAYEPRRRPPQSDSHAMAIALCDRIDGRHPRTAGRGDRLERIVRAIVARLDFAGIDAYDAAFAARLTSLARTGHDGSADDVFGLSRLGLEARTSQALTAARILAAAPAFAPFAAVVSSTEEWYDGSGLPEHHAGEAIDPIARILAVALAAEAVTAGDARRRIAAAAGTRLDPRIVDAYLAAEGAQ